MKQFLMIVYEWQVDAARLWPWLRVGAKIVSVPEDNNGRLDANVLEKKLGKWNKPKDFVKTYSRRIQWPLILKLA